MGSCEIPRSVVFSIEGCIQVAGPVACGRVDCATLGIGESRVRDVMSRSRIIRFHVTYTKGDGDEPDLNGRRGSTQDMQAAEPLGLIVYRTTRWCCYYSAALGSGRHLLPHDAVPTSKLLPRGISGSASGRTCSDGPGFGNS